jgi:hypothetical protein
MFFIWPNLRREMRQGQARHAFPNGKQISLLATVEKITNT